MKNRTLLMRNMLIPKLITRALMEASVGESNNYYYTFPFISTESTISEIDIETLFFKDIVIPDNVILVKASIILIGNKTEYRRACWLNPYYLIYKFKKRDWNLCVQIRKEWSI